MSTIASAAQGAALCVFGAFTVSGLALFIYEHLPPRLQRVCSPRYWFDFLLDGKSLATAYWHHRRMQRARLLRGR